MKYRFHAIYENGAEFEFEIHCKGAQTIRDAWVIASRISTERESVDLIDLSYKAVVIGGNDDDVSEV